MLRLKRALLFYNVRGHVAGVRAALRSRANNEANRLHWPFT